MRRSTIILLLVPLFAFGFYQYCIRKIGSKLTHIDSGFWGTHDAEFDWCEFNYTVSKYIAEICNVLTSFLYCAAAIALARGNAGVVFSPRVPEGHCLGVMLAALFLTGIGSAAFHATLRYDMQLLDELPMFGIPIAAACALRARGNLATRSVKSARERAAQQRHIAFLVAWWCVTALVLCFTTRAWLVHRAMRMVGTLAMCAALILCFTQIQNMAADVARALAAQRATLEKRFSAGACAHFRVATPDFVARLGDGTFLAFLVAVTGWLLENASCAELRGLYRQYGIPANQLHAFFWHGGTCMACWLGSVSFMLNAHLWIALDPASQAQEEEASKALLGVGRAAAGKPAARPPPEGNAVVARVVVMGRTCGVLPCVSIREILCQEAFVAMLAQAAKQERKREAKEFFASLKKAEKDS